MSIDSRWKLRTENNCLFVDDISHGMVYRLDFMASTVVTSGLIPVNTPIRRSGQSSLTARGYLVQLLPLGQSKPPGGTRMAACSWWSNKSGL